MLNAVHLETWQSVIGRPDAWIFTAILALLFPLVDWQFYTWVQSKAALYLWNILAEWTLLAVCGWVMARNGLGFAGIGESFGILPRTLITLGALLVVCLATAISGRGRKQQVDPEQLKKRIGGGVRLLPTNRSERKMFILVAVTAGICEELLYRGWMLPFLGALLHSVWLGLLISSIFFGLAHAYQGKTGVISSSILGAVFGILFIVSGSLVPAQILHIIINLANGISLGKALEAAETERAVGHFQ